MSQTLFNYVEPSSPIRTFPDLLSVGRSDDGLLFVVAREGGDACKTVVIDIDPTTLRAMAHAIFKELGE
jgi:hypothetical protein